MKISIGTRLGLMVVIAMMVLLSSGCGYFTIDTGPTRPSIDDTTSVASGQTLYFRDCSWCHGNQGQGTPRGPDLIGGTNGPAYTSFMLTTGRMPLAATDERSQRRDPVYGSAEIEAIVDYVATLGGSGPDIPVLDVAGGDLGQGLELYQENCASCHSTTLIGGALAGSSESPSTTVIAPEVTQTSPTEVAEAMLVGPGTMPVFDGDTFTDEEVSSIVRYVVHQQHPEDRGGAPIGHVGPVAEGAFGWIVGLGLMLILIRWIGTTTRDD